MKNENQNEDKNKNEESNFEKIKKYFENYNFDDDFSLNEDKSKNKFMHKNAQKNKKINEDGFLSDLFNLIKKHLLHPKILYDFMVFILSSSFIYFYVNYINDVYKLKINFIETILFIIFMTSVIIIINTINKILK